MLLNCKELRHFSVVEFIHQEAAHAGAAGHIAWRRHSTLQLLSHLSPAELRAVYSVPAASNADDLKLFARYWLNTSVLPHYHPWGARPSYTHLALRPLCGPIARPQARR